MRLLVLSDMFSLESWLIDDEKPRIMPAVYNFYNILGRSKQHSFTAIIFHPTVNKVVRFENGSSIHIHSLSVPTHYLRKYFSLNAMKKKALEALSTSEYDVVYGMTIYANVAREVGHHRSIPSVARLFGSLIWDTIQKGQRLKLHTRFRYQYLEAKKPCDVIICTEDGTEFDKALAHLNPKKQAHMLYNGMDQELRKRLLAIPVVTTISRSPNLISIGRLTQWKRHDLAIQIMDHLVHVMGVKNSRLVILGKGEEEANLKSMIADLKLTQHIEIKKPIPHEELPDYLRNFEIGVFMYDASNLGNAMWETALSGRMICTRPTGKTGEIFSGGENCILSHDPITIAEQIGSRIDNRVDNLARASRAIVDQLLPTWEERIENEMQILTEVTSNLKS